MIYFPRGTEMFHFPRLSSPRLCVQRGITPHYRSLGLPIRRSAGQWLFSASPRLIAAVHALHRLLVPRHPPCALTILTVILWVRTSRFSPGDTRYIGYCAVFKVRKEVRRHRRRPGTRSSSDPRVGAPVSQNSTACNRISAARERASPCGRPGSVDMSSGRMRSEGETRELRTSPRCLSPASGALAMEGSLERR